MEHEIRYFFGFNDLCKIKKLLLKYDYRFSAKELTVMYDNPNPEFSFYNQEIDGRLRLRTSQIIEDTRFGVASNKNHESFCLLTWKRRLPNHRKGCVRHEEEIESFINLDDSGNMEQILGNVLRCPRISSYERVRHNFDSKCAKITLDEFPYGLMLEFELKDEHTEDSILAEVESCGLKLEEASSMSCDDKYVELCKSNNLLPKSDILLSDKNMPKIL